MISRAKKERVVEEPVGIVITSGKTIDTPPRFAAFVWGPVPDAELDTATATATTKAA